MFLYAWVPDLIFVKVINIPLFMFSITVKNNLSSSYCFID